MAPKRPNPLENPPAASSSEDDEEDASSEEETDQDEKKEGVVSDDEEDDDEDSPVKKPEIVLPVAIKKLNPLKPEASESEAESGSQSESESDSEPERTKNNTVKPLATKPMLESNKPDSAVVCLPANSAVKRPSSESGKDGKEAKRAKKTEEAKKPEDDEGKKTGEDTKKQLFQRLFSEDDEIALLQGILEFTATKGDPYDHMDAFCEFVKKSINFNASRAQLFDKIRRLKRKFENSVLKSVKKGKNGEDRVFSKAHDQKAFDLWKKIWGSDGALHSAPKSAKSKKNQGGSSKTLVLAASNDFFASPKKGETKREGDKEGVSNLQLVRCKNEGISGRDMISLLKMENALGFDELTVIQGWEMADEHKKREVEEKWKKIRAAQMELLLQRNKFIGEAARLILEALKVSDSGFGH